MILFVLMACLGMSLFVTYTYIITGVHSHTHRLLPLVLGLISLTDLYQIVEYMTKEYFVFEMLEKLLLVQMLFLLVHYVADMLHMNFSKATEIGLFTDIIFADAVIFAKTYDINEYDFIYWVVVVCYISIILYHATKVFFSKDFSRQERRVNLMLYLALLVPSICLLIRNLAPGDWKETVVPLTLSFSCGIVYYLMHTQQLVDTMTLMKENIYDTSDIAAILFDEDYYYLDANEAARKLFPKELREMPTERSKKPYTGQLENVLNNPDKIAEFTIGDEIYYQCNLQPVVYRNKQKGYILSIVNITKQKRETFLMEQLKEMAEEQTLQKGRFLASMSHELRSPLHTIIGISDIILSQNV